MPHGRTRRILLVQENIQSARYTRFLLEEAGYLVDWRPTVTPEMLRTESPSDAVLFDFHFLDGGELSGQRMMREHPGWRAVPLLVAASVSDRETRLLLRSQGADEVIPKPFSAQELIIRLEALFRATSPSLPIPNPKAESTVNPAFLRQLAQFAASHTSPEAMEATMVQLLLFLRGAMAFDVGYVCAEGASGRYCVVAHVGDATCKNARWYVPGMSYTGWIAEHKQALVVPDIDKEDRVRMLGRERGGNRHFHSFLGVPILRDEHVIGTVEVAFYRPGAPNERTLHAMERAGQIAALALSNSQARRELTRQVGRGSNNDQEEIEMLPLVCQSAAMQDVLRAASRVRESAVPVLVTGETGTGKGVMARYLHQSTARRRQPFVWISCATIPESFQFRELFGIEKSIGPGIDGRAGRLEECGQGTLFLDEVGHMSLSLQAKLLRVLDDRQFSRVGANTVLHFAGRVVAATSVNLQAAIQAGTFLPELYHRLALIELCLPPLRQRSEDIPALAQHFNERFRLEQRLPVTELSAYQLWQLTTLPWPGNVRELKNAVERSILLSDGAEFALPGTCAPVAHQADFNLEHVLAHAMENQWSVPDLEQQYARYIYEQVGRNKAQACRILKINYRTLCNHLGSKGEALPSVISRPN